MNPLIRRTNKNNVNEIRNDYEFLGFKHNPFPIDPVLVPNSEDERLNGSIFLKELRIDEIQSFKRITLSQPYSISLLMDYAGYRGRGIGKTAFLNYIKKQINMDWGDTISEHEQVIYAIYVRPEAGKERKFWEVNQLIYKALEEQGAFEAIFARMRALYGEIDENIIECINPDNLRHTILDDKWLSEQGVDVSQINRNLSRIFKIHDIDTSLLPLNTDYKNTFDFFKSKIVSDEHSSIFWRKNGSNLIFNIISKLFKVADFSNCIILFDEAEKIIQNQNSSERREFCNDLRYHFVDGNVDNAAKRLFKILLTIHPYSQELLQPYWIAAGLERIAALGGEGASLSTILFNPIKTQFALPLALEYLNAARLETAITVDKNTPFTEEVLKFALEKSDGIPGKYLKLLYISIEYAITNKLSLLSEKDIETVWQTNNRPDNKKKEINMILPETYIDLNQD